MSIQTHKLHHLRTFLFSGLRYYLCYFWYDDSVFSVDYRRCFVFLPESEYLENGNYEIDKLVDYIISSVLAKSLFDGKSIIKSET